MPGKYIRRLARKSGTFVDTVVAEGMRSDAVFWHTNVQLPFIAGTGRLDRHWNWPRLVTWTPILEKTLLRNSVYLQLSCQKPDGRAFPVGQVLISDGYPFLLDHAKPSIFLWYLAGAPETALEANHLPKDLKLMRPLVDIAIQFSFQRGYDGRLSLHAAAGGGRAADRDLLQKYGKGCKLIPLGRSGRVSPVRKNDGRYFYADPQRAVELSADLDYLR